MCVVCLKCVVHIRNFVCSDCLCVFSVSASEVPTCLSYVFELAIAPFPQTRTLATQNRNHTQQHTIVTHQLVNSPRTFYNYIPTKLLKSYVNFRCIYFHLKMIVRPKHVLDDLNKIVNNYWNRVALDGNPWTWSNKTKRMQVPKFKISNCKC
jgi:hypothetical protein